MLNRASILASNDRQTESVPVDEWAPGESVTVRSLSAAEFMTLIDKIDEDQQLSYALWVAATVVDETGNPMFSSADVEALAKKNVKVLERIVDAAQRLNLARKEYAEKNSAALAASSPSSSH